MNIHKNVKSSYRTLRRTLSNNRLFDYWWLLEQEVDSWSVWVSLPLSRRIWLWRHGYTSLNGKLYDFDGEPAETFLSELQRKRFYERINERHRYLLDDKLSQHWMLADHPTHRPTAFGLVRRGYVHRVPGTERSGPPRPVSDWFPEQLRTESPLVLKQLRGTGGKEVIVCRYEDGRFLLDGEELSEERLCDRLRELPSYLVTEFVDQHDYADELYPHSTNTMRIVTLWDDEAEELLTPVAVHRVGTERSRPVDNFSSGGVAAEIDLETGELGAAAQYPFSGDVQWYSTHPDTGSEIEGAVVPEWNSVRETVERIARENSHIPVLGWDIVVNGENEPVIIEVNTGTGVQFIQVHRPLLQDERVASIVSRTLQE